MSATKLHTHTKQQGFVPRGSISTHEYYLTWVFTGRVVSTSSNPKAGGSPLVGCPRITYRNEIFSSDVQKLILASKLGYHKLAVTEISSALWETVGLLN
jgi:hypothetical protein